MLAASLTLGACTSRGLVTRNVAARGSLAYHATLVGTRLLASIELGLRFELVVRRFDDGFRLLELGRIDLGPPDWDATAISAATIGPLVWIGSRDGTVRGFDVSTMKVAHRWPVGSAVTSVDVSADGRRLAYGTDDGIVCLRRLPDGALLQCVHQGDRRVTALAMSDDQLISATTTGELIRWRLPSLEVVDSIDVEGEVSVLSFSTNGELAVAVGGRPGHARPAGKLILIGKEGRTDCWKSDSAVTSLEWIGDGTMLAAGANDGTLGLWSTEGGRCQIARLRSLSQPIAFVISKPSQRALVVGLWAKERDQKTIAVIDYTNAVR